MSVVFLYGPDQAVRQVGRLCLGIKTAALPFRFEEPRSLRPQEPEGEFHSYDGRPLIAARAARAFDKRRIRFCNSTPLAKGGEEAPKASTLPLSSKTKIRCRESDVRGLR
jgi:hypothetical protein